MAQRCPELLPKRAMACNTCMAQGETFSLPSILPRIQRGAYSFGRLTYLCPMRWLLFLPLFFLHTLWGQGTVVFSENFQSGIPASFTLLNLDQNTPNAQVAEFTNAWISVTDPNNASDTVAAATSFFTSPDTANRWLITPPISLGAYGNYLTWMSKSQDASYPDSYLVLLSTTDNQTSSFTDTLAFVVGENPSWTTRQVNLTGQGYNNQTVRIGFVLRSFDAFKLYLNNLEVRTLDNTSILDLTLNRFQGYPNPTNDYLMLKNKPENLPVMLYDLQGTLLDITYGNMLSLLPYARGTYIITCEGFLPIRIQKN
ncbi:MAG: T9SS C-terminal target domain-containing protein [Flavobacteriia bacterium]|nr:T9SS C-terminal target domain-containing protein [Flavobacteriia bacterium]